MYFHGNIDTMNPSDSIKSFKEILIQTYFKSFWFDKKSLIILTGLDKSTKNTTLYLAMSYLKAQDTSEVDVEIW